jgi:SAM-dependent methyltransferase
VAGSPLDHISELFRAPLWETLDPVAGLNVLDVGCGSGWLAAELHEAGAHVVGIDGAANLLALARATHPEITFLQQDLSRGLPGFECEFDRAVAHMVVMDVEPLVPLVRDVRRALRHGGRFALTMPHPCFFNFPSVIDQETREWSRRITRYLEPEVWRIDSYGGHNHYHRTLTFYFDILRSHGFSVSRLFEPAQSEGSGDAEARAFRRSIPVFLFIEAVVVDDGAA